jgi:hypothetical protein
MNDDPRENPPANSSPGERFEILWTDYLEGVLDPAGMAVLDALLAADERLVARAADLYQTHRQLGLLVGERGTLAGRPRVLRAAALTSAEVLVIDAAALEGSRRGSGPFATMPTWVKSSIGSKGTLRYSEGLIACVPTVPISKV